MSLRILIAPDKFKGSLAGVAICEIIEKGLKSAHPGLECISLPLADGGDGLLDMVLSYRDAVQHNHEVPDPLSRTVKARWLLSTDGQIAYIEMAEASGLHLLQPAEYDCLRASSFGTGLLIREAIEAGAREIVIGIGGSATNDGGIGMAAALGIRFLDAGGTLLKPEGQSLARIARIDTTGKVSLKGIRFRVACDVKNPLLGPLGATRVYGPQKGADPETVEMLEAGMANYARILRRDVERGVPEEGPGGASGEGSGEQQKGIAGREGAGAAGGLGAACMAFLGAEFVSGTDLAIDYSHAEEHARDADWIITAEGKLDGQTLQGKLVSGVAALGLRYHKPVVVLCGLMDLGPGQLKDAGITAAFSIVNGPITLEESMENAADLLYRAAYSLGGLIGRGMDGEG